jgi:hypothetical protein
MKTMNSSKYLLNCPHHACYRYLHKYFAYLISLLFPKLDE